ncbi:hypothetical protein POKO110462_12660 [Pontibacter korlensis]
MSNVIVRPKESNINKFSYWFKIMLIIILEHCKLFRLTKS